MSQSIIICHKKPSFFVINIRTKNREEIQSHNRAYSELLSRYSNAIRDFNQLKEDSSLFEKNKAEEISQLRESLSVFTKGIVDETKWKSICKDAENADQDFYGHYYTVNNAVLGEDGKAKVETKTYCDLAVYYINNTKLAASEKNVMEYVSENILNKEDPNVALNNGVKADDKYKTNLIVFTEKSFVAYKAPVGVDSYAAAIQGKYDFGKTLDLKDLYKMNIDGKAYKEELGTSAHRDAVLSTYSKFFALSWESTKNTIGWQYSGIALAINAGLVFLFGLMIWLMTRGKQNPYHDFNFLDAQKISWWSASAPALLSLIGFIPFFASFAMFLFLFLMGMRTMWMSTRTLRPYGAQ